MPAATGKTPDRSTGYGFVFIGVLFAVNLRVSFVSACFMAILAVTGVLAERNRMISNSSKNHFGTFEIGGRGNFGHRR